MTNRSLWKELAPYEHGSWGLFLAPLAVGAFAGRGNPLGQALLTVSALGVFLIRRPALRWLRAFGRESMDHIVTPWPGRAFAVCLALLLGGGIPLLLMGRPLLLWVFGLAVCMIWSEAYLEYVWQHHELIAELAVVWVLCLLAPSAYYVGSGVLDQKAWMLWLLCAAYFSVTVSDIRVQLAKFRVTRGVADPALVDQRRVERAWSISGTVMAVCLVLAMAPRQAYMLAALAPLAVRPFRRPRFHVTNPTAIRSLGWQEVFLSVVFALLAILIA